MVCHESGGSGSPLTDYVNNIDYFLMERDNRNGTFITYNTPTNRNTARNQPNTTIQDETSTNPTTCAQATANLEYEGLQLTQVNSHFPGYNVEVFSGTL